MQSNIIDVSHHQQKIDWNKVKAAGVEAAYIKCSNGSHGLDDMYKYNASEARRVGILVGAYHFLLSQQNVDEQIENFLANKGANDLLPCLDVEWDFKNNVDQWKIIHPTTRITMIGKFIKRMKQSLGVLPLIYTNRFWWRAMIGNEREYEDVIFNYCPLWLADYSTIQDNVLKCPPWESFTLRQFSERGKINGIQNFVDINRLNGAKELAALKMY